MATYAIRVVDDRTGERLRAGGGLATPHAAGSVAADAHTVLIGRDGY